MLQSENYDLYMDIQKRTNGELFLGVAGPVRSGKSTFIRQFMSQAVLPGMEEYRKNITVDELPVSGKGTLITTVEPKFVPREAIELNIGEDVHIKLKLIDCVGYVVEGATGIYDNGNERMVKTPWFKEEIPFTKAADIGTEKVIRDHATVGIVITGDGSFGEIGRQQFISAEEKTVNELKMIGKPFVIVLNCVQPHSEHTKKLAEEMSERYGVACLPVNCDQMKTEDIYDIMRAILYEFPVISVNFYMPKWVNMLPEEHELRKETINSIRSYLNQISTMKDVWAYKDLLKHPDLEKYYIETIDMASGVVTIQLTFASEYYYQMLSEVLGQEIHGEYEFFNHLAYLASKRHDIEKVSIALEEVRQKGYGAVMPRRSEITLQEPVLVRHGSKYGVNIKATAPSIHMINADLETEIAPIVGTQQQAQDLIDYIKSAQSDSGNNNIWNTLIFGKTMGELVDEGMKTKIDKMTDTCQEKMQETLRKIMNESNGNVIFVII